MSCSPLKNIRSPFFVSPITLKHNQKHCFSFLQELVSAWEKLGFLVPCSDSQINKWLREKNAMFKYLFINIKCVYLYLYLYSVTHLLIMSLPITIIALVALWWLSPTMCTFNYPALSSYWKYRSVTGFFICNILKVLFHFP